MRYKKVPTKVWRGAGEITLIGEEIAPGIVLIKSSIKNTGFRGYSLTHSPSGFAIVIGKNKKALRVLGEKFASLGDWTVSKDEISKMPYWEKAKELYKTAQTLLLINT
jgi:hypothetical protein